MELYSYNDKSGEWELDLEALEEVKANGKRGTEFRHLKIKYSDGTFSVLTDKGVRISGTDLDAVLDAAMRATK